MQKPCCLVMACFGTCMNDFVQADSASCSPAGSVLSEDNQKEIVKFCVRESLVLLADEVRLSRQFDCWHLLYHVLLLA